MGAVRSSSESDSETRHSTNVVVVTQIDAFDKQKDNMKKKRFRFQVNFALEQLSSVPFVTGVLFGKVRLLDGGNFKCISPREEVSNHCVKWEEKFQFSCRMCANASTGVLETCLCRVSIRKEMKGGKSFVKLGFVDINLAEFPGAGNTCRRYLLEGYDTKDRQDNSILSVTIDMSLLSGDPCFKVPDIKQLSLPLPSEAPDDMLFLGGGGGDSYHSIDSKPKARPSVFTSGLVSAVDSNSVEESSNKGGGGHSRSSSYNSQQSRPPGGGGGGGPAPSNTHSRSSSYNDHYSSAASLSEPPTESVKDSWKGSTERRRKYTEEHQQRRVDNTRVNADEIIDTLISQQDFNDNSNNGDEGGLQLYVAKDGSTALGSHQLKTRMSAGVFEPVVIENR